MRKMIAFLGVILILALGVSKSVMAFSLTEKGWSKEEYQRMEAEYIEKVRLVLLEKGCKNAGITLTYMLDREEERKYTVTVHHRKLLKMDTKELGLVQARMKEAGIEVFGEQMDMVKILSDR